MKRWLLLLSLCFAVPAFSQQLPGMDYFFGLLGKDTAAVFDSLRKAGFRGMTINPDAMCCGDLGYEDPGKCFCATFVNDSAELSLIFMGDRGLGDVALTFSTSQALYIRSAEQYLVTQVFVRDKEAPTYGGYKRFYRDRLTCELQNYRNNYFIRVRDNGVFFTKN